MKNLPMRWSAQEDFDNAFFVSLLLKWLIRMFARKRKFAKKDTLCELRHTWTSKPRSWSNKEIGRREFSVSRFFVSFFCSQLCCLVVSYLRDLHFPTLTIYHLNTRFSVLKSQSDQGCPSKNPWPLIFIASKKWALKQEKPCELL